VSIDSLIPQVVKLADRARRYENVFKKSEAAVRSSLIEPFLKLWGWDVEDPAQVRPEFSTQAGKPDYALLGDDGKPVAFSGAKSLGKQEDLDQYITYCVREGVGYFITSDGVQWEVYETFAPKPLHEKLVTRWNLVTDTPIEVLRKSFAIAKGTEVRDEAPRPIIKSPKSSRRGETLGKISPMKSKLPINLVFPDGQRFSIKHWNELLTSIVGWLHGTGRLTKQSLPLTTPKSGTRYLVNIEPKHKTGARFRQPKQVGNLYVETHYSSKDILRLSKHILRMMNVDPDSIVVETS
jgi:hypothetical protein